MSQPQRKPNFLNLLLPYLVIFVAIQLFFTRNQAPPDTRTSAQILAEMKDQSIGRQDVSIVSNRSSLNNKVDAEVSTKVITPAEAETRKMQGVIYVATAELNAGNHSGEVGRLEASYQTLLGEWKSRKDTPIWTDTTFEEPGIGNMTADKFYDQVRDTLNAKNKQDLVYGFIPAFNLVDTLVKLSGSNPSFSYALAALILAIVVRAVIFPLSQRQLMWGRQMAQLTPMAREIKEKYKDPQEQGLKTMELYKEYGINPYAGCLPAFIQLPLFLTVYRCMLHYRFEFVKGTFLWISPAGHSFWPGFAANLGLEDKTLIVIYSITMLISTLLTPVSDPTNAKQQRAIGVSMALMFGVMMFIGLFPVPAAFVLYWTFTNLLATAQSLRAYRLPLPPLVKVNAPSTGGVLPTQPRKTGWMDLMQEAMKKKMEEAQQAEKEKGGKPETNGKIIDKKVDDIQPYRHPTNGKTSKPSSGGGKKKPKKRT